MPVGVKVKNNNVDKALSRFKKKVEKAGILKQYMNNQYYTKPSKKRRDAHKVAVRKQNIQTKKNRSSV